jgi:hypothetical protein
MIESAQAKLALLAQAAGDARALREAAKRQADDARNRVQALINAQAGEVEIAKAAEQVERAQDLMAVRHRKYEDAEQLCTRLRSWLNELPRDVVLEPVPAPTIALNGAAPQHVVGTIRAEIAKLAAEFHTIRTAPASPDDARRQVRELVARLGKKGAPRISTQFGKLDVYGWENPAQEFGPTFHSITIATLCWAVPDVMIARLDETLDALPRNEGALPVSERASRLAEIEAEIMLLESREEHLIERAARDGVQIERRFDQSPASVLGVKVSAASARAAA